MASSNDNYSYLNSCFYVKAKYSYNSEEEFLKKIGLNRESFYGTIMHANYHWIDNVPRSRSFFSDNDNVMYHIQVTKSLYDLNLPVGVPKFVIANYITKNTAKHLHLI